MCMKFYDDSKPLYFETDTSGVGFGVALLFCFVRDVNVITDHKPLVAIFEKV